jgi:hypothetical protein
MSLKLGALAAVATDVSAPSRMTVIDADTQRPLTAIDGKDEGERPILKECYIDFMSIDSEAGRKLDRVRNAAAFRKARSGRNIVDDEDPVDVQVETLTALTTGWYFGPDAEVFTSAAARELFANPEYAWLRKQGYVFVHSEANFIKRSSTTSAASPSTNSNT